MKVTAKVAHTMNLGEYESVRPEVWIEDDVEKGETVEQAYKRASSIAHKLWAAELQMHLGEHAVARKTVEKSQRQPLMGEHGRSKVQLQR